jgi:SAM-dependent methyltransferase
MPALNAYRDDLAYIHDVGYGDLAIGAAGRLVEELAIGGFPIGHVLDLGCGTGILAGHVSSAGYQVTGLDISAAMVAIARTRVPTAEFRVGSFVSADLPVCVAVTAIGEVLNYMFDESNDREARDRLFDRVSKALVPGGLFMFDMAGLNRASPGGPHRTFAEGSDWAVLVETNLNETSQVLVRKITSFRRVGTTYQRDTETHRLILVDPNQVSQSLRSVGFEVHTLSGYTDRPMPFGITGFLCRKPTRDAVKQQLEPGAS